MATEVFGKKGYFETSIDDITTAAGTSRATLYAHFPGKEAVLAEIVERMFSEVKVLYSEFSELEEWSRPSIHRWVTNFAKKWQKDAARNKVGTEAALPQLVQRRPVLHRELIEHLRSRPEPWAHFTPKEADARASMMVYLLQGEFPGFFFSDVRGSQAAFIDQITDALLDLLRVSDRG